MGSLFENFAEMVVRDSMVASGQSAYGDIHTPEQKETLAAIDTREAAAPPVNPKMAEAISTWLKADPNNFQTAIDRTRSAPNGDLELYDNLHGTGFYTVTGAKGLNDQTSNFSQIGDWVSSTYDWMNKDPEGFQAWADSDPRNATRFFSRLALGDAGLGGGNRTLKDNVFGMTAKDFNNAAAYYATQEAIRRGMGSDNKEDGKTIAYEYSGDVAKGVNNQWGSGDFYKIGTQNSMKGGLKDFVRDNPLETAGLIALAAFAAPAAAGAAGSAAAGYGAAAAGAASGAAGAATLAGGSSLIMGNGVKDSLGNALKAGVTGAVTGGTSGYLEGLLPVASTVDTAGNVLNYAGEIGEGVQTANNSGLLSNVNPFQVLDTLKGAYDYNQQLPPGYSPLDDVGEYIEDVLTNPGDPHAEMGSREPQYDPPEGYHWEQRGGISGEWVPVRDGTGGGGGGGGGGAAPTEGASTGVEGGTGSLSDDLGYPDWWGKEQPAPHGWPEANYGFENDPNYTVVSWPSRDGSGNTVYNVTHNGTGDSKTIVEGENSVFQDGEYVPEEGEVLAEQVSRDPSKTPTPNEDLPEGYEWVWVSGEGWKLESDDPTDSDFEIESLETAVIMGAVLTGEVAGSGSGTGDGSGSGTGTGTGTGSGNGAGDGSGTGDGSGDGEGLGTGGGTPIANGLTTYLDDGPVKLQDLMFARYLSAEEMASVMATHRNQRNFFA